MSLRGIDTGRMELMELKGFVIKCVGGFYTVETGEGPVVCRARGRFRKEGVSPCAGDQVMVSTMPDGTGALTEILPRRNHLVRPPVANLDRLFIVASLREPAAGTVLIDKAVAAAELKGIDPVVVFTKTDLGDPGKLLDVYRLAGVSCCAVCSQTGQGVEQVRELARGKVSAFIGNSGVGKSTLLNAAFPGFCLKTGEVSQKLGRGRHTTREVEFFPLEGGGYAADTPGFSTFDIERYRLTDKEQLIHGFREMAALAGNCRFSSCTHTCEKGCAVLQAVDEGTVARSRLESYTAMYQEIKDVKQWEQKNKLV